MAHRLDRCDFIDVLEEAAVFHRPVEVVLKSGDAFEDGVRDVVTERGEDYAIFNHHDRIPISAISDCRRARGGATA